MDQWEGWSESIRLASHFVCLNFQEFAQIYDSRDVTALATQVNKCTEVKWVVNFNIMGNGKMVKNGLYLFKFSDFFKSVCLFWRENIVICPATIILIIKGYDVEKHT